MNTGVNLIPFISSLTIASALEIFYYVLLLIFIIHAVTLIYHWHAFGTDRSIATTATIIYLGFGSLLLIFMITLLNTF